MHAFSDLRSSSRDPAESWKMPALSGRVGFTLIEVLVVVAIIALLVAILIPALTQARTLAKVTTCQVNSKQIGTAIAAYQSEQAGFVPIMFNWHSGPAYGPPASTCYLSLALRKFEKGLAGLAHSVTQSGQALDPLEPWTIQMRDEYEARFLPEHYVCPFERGRQPWDLRQVGTGPGAFTQWEWTGVMESYQTWLWEDIFCGKTVHSEPSGSSSGLPSPLDGLPKYSVLTWNQVTPMHMSPTNPDIQTKLHRRWTDAEARAKGSNLSSLTVVYCAIGEHMEMGSRRIDVGSHRKGRMGGTNAIFADTHVEWVQGTRIGWP